MYTDIPLRVCQIICGVYFGIFSYYHYLANKSCIYKNGFNCERNAVNIVPLDVTGATQLAHMPLTLAGPIRGRTFQSVSPPVA